MRISYVFILWLGQFWMQGHYLFGQQLSFRHLGGQQGLKNMTVYNAVLDHYGFMWLSTFEGLVRFNGKEIKYYDEHSNPALPTDAVRYVFCDSRNQVWVCTYDGLVMLDQKRQVHRQNIDPENPGNYARWCMEDEDGTIYALTYNGMFYLPREAKSWLRDTLIDAILPEKDVYRVSRFDANTYLLTYPEDGVVMVDLKEKKEEAFYRMPSVNCAVRYDDDYILIGKRFRFGLLKASIHNPGDTSVIEPPAFLTLTRQHEQITEMVRAVDGNFYLTTSGIGLLVLDATLKNYTSYKHDPVDPLSLIDNSLSGICTDSSGLIFINSWEGVNYTNVHNSAITYVNYLKDEEGQISDDRVVSLAEDDAGNIWLCTRFGVYIHSRSKSETRKILIPPAFNLRLEDVYPMCIEKDPNGNMWVVFRYDGIGIFSREGIMKKWIRPDDHPEIREEVYNARIIRDGKDGFMYVGANRGLFRIGLTDHTVDTFAGHKAIFPLFKQRIIDIMPVKNGIWITSSPHGAAYHYSFEKRLLKRFDHKKGLASNRAYGITEDQKGNVYVGTNSGLSFIDARDSITNYLKGKGLEASQIESIEADHDGNLWMTNNFNILKFDPITKNIYQLGRRQGLPLVNYAYNASRKLSTGEIAFGASNGFVIIDPAKIKFDAKEPELFVYYHDENGHELAMAPGQKLKFAYYYNQVRFSYSLNDLIINDQVSYQYRLSSGVSSSWSNPSLNNTVDFNLNPGDYIFEVQGFDGEKWIEWKTPISIIVMPPWWKQWWFLGSVFFLVILFLLLYYRGRIRKYKNELIIARQISDLESKALRAQMNPHFVFNSLNAIQECIVTGRVEEAYTYLSKFSRLLRLVLEHSDSGEVTLHDELEVLDLYISLEKLRFKNDMHYQFELDSELDPEEIWIPPMLIQPHLENAIWHGLRHKEGEKNLLLSIKETTPDYLEVIIQDDGIGRSKSSLLKKDRLGGSKHQSKGRQLSENRLEVFRKSYPLTSMTIHDLYHPDNTPAGTKVTIMIPMLKKIK